MSAYRFCRTDDMPLLVEARNRCDPHERPLTLDGFKRLVRDLQIWCSSCMVAFAGDTPVGVLLGAKRRNATLIRHIAVHPDHARRGHARHLLTSLSAKLAILGPPVLVAEVPDDLPAATALFEACGYGRRASYADWTFERAVVEDSPAPEGVFPIPVTVDDLAANDLLEPPAPCCWERSTETLLARKGEIEGEALASHERIEAFVLHRATSTGREIVALRSVAESPGDALLGTLVGRLARRGAPSTIPRVHPEEIADVSLERWGFRRGRTYGRFETEARPA